MPPHSFLGLRDEFAVVERYAYLNHAAIGPLPRRAVQRMASLAATVAETGEQTWLQRNQESERVRDLIRCLLGAREAHEVAFVQNTSAGLSLVAAGLPWQPGENVVGAACEFPSNVYPWMQLADFEVEFRMVPERDGRLDLDELLAQVDERTRVLALSWVQYASGFRADLARIGAFCQERGVLFVVDGIQGLGALELDVEASQVDVLAAGCHKWLLGPEGLGILYVSDRVVERIRPSHLGWHSVREWDQWETFNLDLASGAKRYEPGNLNAYSIHALGASLEILLEAGPAAVEARVLALTDRLVAGLEAGGFNVASSRRPGEASGIVVATYPEVDSSALAHALAEEGVIVSSRAGRLRISPHFYNTEEEIDRLLAMMDAVRLERKERRRRKG